MQFNNYWCQLMLPIAPHMHCDCLRYQQRTVHKLPLQKHISYIALASAPLSFACLAPNRTTESHPRYLFQAMVWLLVVNNVAN